MSKFNTIVKEASHVHNNEGAEAYKLTPEMELYTAVVASSLSDKFYETAKEQINRMSALIRECDHRFVAQLAVYARTEMNLRSIPLFLVVELAKIHSGDNLVSRTIEKVVCRADEIMELLICYQWRNPIKQTPSTGHLPKEIGFTKQGFIEVVEFVTSSSSKVICPWKKLARLSNQVKVGLQHAFNRFDEYQFAKYDRDNLEVKLRDALFLVHPKAKDDAQQELFNKIANRTLQTPYTWETELSALGQEKFDDKEAKQAAFAEKWAELVSSGKLGYMALLRNLRNILEADVDLNTVKDVAERIGDAHEVLKSKQFPFRFLSAYRELKTVCRGEVSTIMDALEDAVVATAQNIKGFDKKTRVLLACDVSFSMFTRISEKSSVKYYDIGLVLAMLLKNRCDNVVSGIFGTEWKVVNMPSKGILSNVELMHKREGEVGYSTNGYMVIEYLRTNNILMDKVMMFTDCQMWDSYGSGKTIQAEWEKYKEIAPKAKLYLFDLDGYGQSPLKLVGNDVALIAGWSDKIFDMLDAFEQGDDVLDKIKGIEL